MLQVGVRAVRNPLERSYRKMRGKIQAALARAREWADVTKFGLGALLAAFLIGATAYFACEEAEVLYKLSCKFGCVAVVSLFALATLLFTLWHMTKAFSLFGRTLLRFARRLIEVVDERKVEGQAWVRGKSPGYGGGPEGSDGF